MAFLGKQFFYRYFVFSKSNFTCVFICFLICQSIYHTYLLFVFLNSLFLETPQPAARSPQPAPRTPHESVIPSFNLNSQETVQELEVSSIMLDLVFFFFVILFFLTDSLV